MVALSSKTKLTCDVLLLIASIPLFQEILYNHQPISRNASMALVLLSILTWVITGTFTGLYRDYRKTPFSFEWVVFIKTLLIYTLVISFISFQFFKTLLYIRWIIFFQCGFIFLLFPIQKLIVREVFKRICRSGNLTKKVLIIGSGEHGMDFYNRIVKDAQYGYSLTGFIDDKRDPLLNGSYLGKPSDLEHVISKHELDDIIVTAPHTETSQLKTIVEVAEKEGKRIHILPNYHQFSPGRVQIRHLGNVPLVSLRSLPLDAMENKFHKRLFDIAFSFCVIVCVLSWLFPLIALVIKLTSKGPVMFKQERWGRYNRPIICYKFRSMVCTSKDVDEKGVYQQAKKDDPRITPIGKFLRKTNLDELPQFFNVLYGSMSVVGPRPHPIPLNIASKGAVDNYMMRNWVKPGITGYAQIKGFRGETRKLSQMEKRVEADIWYMENWTFWLDLQIIVQTLVNMVKGEKNAF